jgi:hypothetical protein
VDPVFRRDLQRHKVPTRAANNHFGINDSHFKFSSPVAPLSASLKQLSSTRQSAAVNN